MDRVFFANSGAEAVAGMRDTFETAHRQLYGFAELPFDDSGRFVMPDYLRGLADIENGLFFQGSGRFFSVWNPAELMRMGDDWAAAKAACQALVAEAEAKAKRK